MSTKTAPEAAPEAAPVAAPEAQPVAQGLTGKLRKRERRYRIVMSTKIDDDNTVARGFLANGGADSPEMLVFSERGRESAVALPAIGHAIISGLISESEIAEALAEKAALASGT